MLIGIVDYGKAGNTYNLIKALDFIGVKSKLLHSTSDYKSVDKIILPGVGNFSQVIKEINTELLLETLQSKPTLGICIGMQLLMSQSIEDGVNQGLNIFSSSVDKFDCIKKVNYGFQEINCIKASPLLDGIENPSFYHMHSYFIRDEEYQSATATFENITFTTIVERDNIFGVQFHPEKSGTAGLKLLKNFIKV